jgi:hypothetical protein
VRQQGLAEDCIEVLRATVDKLSDWSAAVERAIQQQQQQLTPGTQQHAQQRSTVCELQETRLWLLLAAASLLHNMWCHKLLCSLHDKRQLLDALGQLARQVLGPLLHSHVALLVAPPLAMPVITRWARKQALAGWHSLGKFLGPAVRNWHNRVERD